MKTRVIVVLTAVIVATFVFVPVVLAQRGGGRAGGGGGGMGGRPGGGMVGGPGISRPAGGFQGRTIPTNPQNSPSTPIAPITNPIAPMMSSPVQPFVNYNNPPVANATRRPGGPVGGFDDRGRFDRDVVVIGGGGYYGGYPYYGGYGLDPLYYSPVLSPAPIPGQLPYTYPLPLFNPAPVPGQLPNTVPLAPEYSGPPLVDPVPPPPIVPPEVIYYEEPRAIIPSEPIVPIKELPLIGTSRPDVEAKYGEPWGVVTIKGKEKVYYRSMVVMYENGQVFEVQRR